MAKKTVSDPILAHRPNLGCQVFFQNSDFASH